MAVVFGLVIGSFLNVVIYRVPRHLSIVHPGSFCPACQTPIRSADNVPVVAWIVLRGRCRHCGEPISARYPAVELATGGLFGALAWVLGPHWAVPGMCALAATILALAGTELDGLPAPAAVSLIGTGVGVGLLGAAAVADRRWWHLGGMVIGAAVAAGALGAAALSTRRHGTRSSLWGLLPAGAAMGWVGAPGAPIGVITTLVVLVVSAVLFRMRPPARRPRRAVAVAAGLGAVAAVVGAFVAGGSIGT